MFSYFKFYHYRIYSHFRRPEAAENKALATENKLFSMALDLFSAISGRQKKSAGNKPLFLTVRGYFRERKKIKNAKNKQFHQQYNHNKITETLNPELHTFST
jgi:hypothetical protein